MTRNTTSFFTIALLAAIPSFAQPPGCPSGAAVLYEFDFESGAGGWTQAGTNGAWVLSNARAHSGTVSAFVPNADSTATEALFSEQITVPPGPTLLRFWAWEEIESNDPISNPPHACYDGAVVEISTMGGGDTYQRLDAEIVGPTYDGTIHDGGTGNPLGGERAWCGDPRDWHEVVVDLSAYAGNDIYLKYILATDSSVGREGWYIDDVRIEQCDSVHFDNFETGDFSAWDAVVQ